MICLPGKPSVALLLVCHFWWNTSLCFKFLGRLLLLLDESWESFWASYFPMPSLLSRLQDGFRCSLSKTGMKNWHFARTRYLPYPECQCLKPPLFKEKLMHWLKRYKRRASPNHIIYLAGLRLLLTTSTSWNFAFSNPQATCWEPKAWNAAPGSKPMSTSLADLKV